MLLNLHVKTTCVYGPLLAPRVVCIYKFHRRCLLGLAVPVHAVQRHTTRNTIEMFSHTAYVCKIKIYLMSGYTVKQSTLVSSTINQQMIRRLRISK